MKVQITRTARTAALAAVTALTLASTAYAYLPTIISSFRMSGTAPPYARGNYGSYGIFYATDGDNYLYKFNTVGSLISAVRLPGAVRLGDADYHPPGYPSGTFGVVDEGANNVKVYSFDGSLVGTWRAAPSNTVGYGVGGHMEDIYYLGTRDGVISVYNDRGSFVNSYATGVPTADLAAGMSYLGYPGYYLFLGPSRIGDPVRVYIGYGSLCGTFKLPGLYNVGAITFVKADYWCLRHTGTEIWAYHVNVGPFMAVEPASLGKVKALFK